MEIPEHCSMELLIQVSVAQRCSFLTPGDLPLSIMAHVCRQTAPQLSHQQMNLALRNLESVNLKIYHCPPYR